MITNQKPVVVLADLAFSWSDETPGLSEINAALQVGRTGLIGANGTGKAALLKLISGELTPTKATSTSSAIPGTSKLAPEPSSMAQG